MKRALTLTLLLCCVLMARAQENDDLTRLLLYMKHAMMFNRATPQEKAYLHFDNTGYFKGETMRFKAYVTRADLNRPTTVSSVLYVELVNPSGDVVLTRKLRVENGEAEGDIQLDSIFGTGFYEVRAYTRYMRNWGDTGIFSRVFPIYRAPAHDGDYSRPMIDELTYTHRLPGREGNSTDAAVQTVKDNGFEVSFYPEGGHMIKGLPSRVAFSVTNKEGRRAAVRGMVNNAAGETLAVGTSDETGRGYFDLIPDGSALTFIVTDTNGKRHSFALPDADEEGCTLRLDAINEDLSAQISASATLRGSLLGYTLMHNGNVVTADTMQAHNAIELAFDRQSMRPGVNQLTVFDSNGRILAERLFFICPPADDADSVKVSIATQQLRPCGKVDVDLTAAPNASISFTAMDVATLTNGSVGNARTWMLLGSEVRGYIENPDFYFEADDEEHRRAADLLMMVQGWRRYDWQLQAGTKGFEELDGYPGKVQPIEDKLYVFGQLRPDMNKWRKKHPVAGVDLTCFLYNAKGEHMQGKCVTDSVGNYAFEMPDVEGEWNMQIHTAFDGKDARYTVAIDRHFSPAARMLSPYETEQIPLPEALQQRKAAAEAEGKDDLSVTLTGKGANSTYVLPTVKVKRRYFTDNTHLPWYDEKTGARKSSVYYNVDEATDRIYDEGEPLPTLFEWLMKKNSFFSGDDRLMDAYEIEVEDPEMFPGAGPLSSTSVDEATVTDKTLLVYKGGPTYKNRPVIWVINNQYFNTTGYSATRYTLEWTSNTSGAAAMPDFIDEVKSVYISEDDDNYRNFIRVKEHVGMHPVTVFVYTHPQFTVASKGLRRTHFQGYNVATAFQMEDYSVMPAMEDFRRTLFWAPSVHTDASGHARVSFFNNSSCRQMYISAEGMTPDGRFVVSE